MMFINKKGIVLFVTFFFVFLFIRLYSVRKIISFFHEFIPRKLNFAVIITYTHFGFCNTRSRRNVYSVGGAADIETRKHDDNATLRAGGGFDADVTNTASGETRDRCARRGSNNDVRRSV